MKILVDKLLYSIFECPFNYGDNWGYELCSCPSDDEYSPMYWTSGHKRECERFIEYDEFMRKTGRRTNE